MRIVAGAALGIGVLALVVPTASGAHPKAKPPARGAPRILYSSDWSGKPEIYLVDPSGRTPTAQITAGGRPNPSPDGRRLLFWRGYRLFLARADGGGQRLIHAFSNGSQYYLAGDPAWAPDSKRFAYGGENGIHVAPADGSHDRLVAPGWAPAWSPDGHSLTFNTARGVAIVGQRGIKLITNNPSGDHFLNDQGTAWSPTGKWIAYTTSSYKVALVSPDGRVHRTLGRGSYPAWSPNGRMLAFEGSDDVEVVDITNWKVLHVAANQFGGWSPDGRTLAVEVWNHTRLQPIDLVDAKTGAVRTRLSANGGDIHWSPDGREFAYAAATEDYGYDLRVGSLTGPTTTVVAAAGDHGGFIDRAQFSRPGWAWTRPPAGTRFRPAPTRSIATVSGDDLTAPWTITRLAADGGRVAYASCGHVFAWTPSTGAVDQAEPVASFSPNCTTPEHYVAFEIYSLAVAGDRVAYGARQGNSGQTWWLNSTTLTPEAGSVTLSAAVGANGCSDDGPGDLSGSNQLLVFSKWREQTGCPPRITEQTIERADPGTCGEWSGNPPSRIPCSVIATSPGPLVPFDVSQGRIVAGGENATVLLDPNGKQLLSIAVSPLAAQLSGSNVIVLTQGQLRDYAATTGEPLHAWPLPDVPSGGECGSAHHTSWECHDHPRLLLEDAARGLVTYVLDGQVHLLRLSDGADAIVAAGSLARFMDAGLVYADGSRLHLIPYDQLPLR